MGGPRGRGDCAARARDQAEAGAGAGAAVPGIQLSRARRSRTRRCRPSGGSSAAEPANIEYRRLLPRAYAESERAARGSRRAAQDHRARRHACRRHGMRSSTPTTPLHRRRWRPSPPPPTARAGKNYCSPTRFCPTAVSPTPLGSTARRSTCSRRWSPSTIRLRASTSRRTIRTGPRSNAPAAGRPTAHCVKRRALCAFRAGRFREALTASGTGKDPESRYWRARAGAELTKDALGHLDRLPDSRERREVRAVVAISRSPLSRRRPRAESGALQFAPKDPVLVGQLGTALYLSRDYEPALEVLAPVIDVAPASDDVQVLTAYGDSLLQLDRVDDAVPLPAPRVHRGHVGSGPPRCRWRAPISGRASSRRRCRCSSGRLAGDSDGSVHVPLSRALAGIGDKSRADAMLAKSQELQRAAQERQAEAGKRTITPPK